MWAIIVIAVLVIIGTIIVAHDQRPAPVNLRRLTVHERAQKAVHGSAQKVDVATALSADSGREDRQHPFAKRHEVRKRITIHGNTSDFVLHDIRFVNVVSVELVTANFPRAQYTIDEHNRHLDFRIGGNNAAIQTIALPPGNHWTAATLQCYLTQNTPMKFHYDAATSKFTVSTTDGSSFMLLFGSGPNRDTSICRELGFECRDYEGLIFTDDAILNAASVQAPNRADISGARYIHILTDEMDGRHDRGLMAEVPVLPPAPFAVYKPGSVDSRKFENPITLRSLSLRIRDYDAAKNALVPYNFNGMYYSMTIEITTLDRDVPVEILSKAENDWHVMEPVYHATSAGVNPSNLR